MTDINVDPTAITNAKSVMKENKDTIVSDLNGLSTAVQTLLTNEGGLWMKQSSPKMSEQFTNFANNLKDAVANIESFAGTFEDILKNLTDLDTGYSNTDD